MSTDTHPEPGAPLRLAVMTASLRKASFSVAVAHTLPELASAPLAIHFLPTLHEVPLYNQDVFDAGLPAAVEALGRGISEADGLVIVTPEYNYSVPGTLKNAIDWLSRLSSKPLAGKPVALMSSSTGALGGVRAQYHLRQVLVAVDARVMNLPEVMIGQVDRKLGGEPPRLTDTASREHIQAQLQALQRFMRG